jgi:hypothetical protein
MREMRNAPKLVSEILTIGVTTGKKSGAQHVASRVEVRNTQKVLVGNPQGKKHKADL